jgi:hypothetical protein
MEPINTEEYKGYQIEIHFDDQPESPRDWDNLGAMALFHPRYGLEAVDTNGENVSDPAEFIYKAAIALLSDKRWPQDKIEEDYELLQREEFIAKYLSLLERHMIILPVYCYEHGGLTIRTSPFSCPWDSNQLGWVYVTRKAVRGIWKKKAISPKVKAKVIENLVGEVELYDQFLQGQVFGFILFDGSEEEIDSCWGYYSEEDLLHDARDYIDNHIKIRKNITK